MKVLNICKTTVFLHDIDIAVTYSREKIPIEIPDKLARMSQNLKWAMMHDYVIDVTKGIPDILPVFDENKYLVPDPESPYFKRQSMLSRDDHNPRHEPALAAAPPQIRPLEYTTATAMEVYRAEGKMSAIWTGPAEDAGGYARMNREFMFGMADKDVNIQYDCTPSVNDMDKGTNERLKALKIVRVPKDTPKIYGMTAPLHYDWARYKMLFTMMETRRLHKDYVERCNCADEIIVPTRWCKEVFQESGVKKPMYVVPLGVDTQLYKPEAEPIGFTKGLKPFIFLSVFGWSLRKGYDVMLRAFLEEFTSDEPVTLLISSRYMGSTDESKKKVIRKDIDQISSMVANPKKPQVVLFGDVLSDTMMPRLYAASDCYVLISRGEGFGLPYMEAAACNIPVIGSRYSGHTDFLNDTNSYLVDVDGFRSAENNLSWISYFYENAEFPIFGAKAVEQTRYFMRKVFENKEEARLKSNKLHQEVVSQYNWPTCISKMHEKLKSTYETLSKG